MKRQFQAFSFHIHNAASGDAVEVYIDGQIVDAETEQIYREWFGDDSSISYKSFRNQLKATNATTYNIYINSPGGLVTDAMAMHDLLVDMRKQGKKVNTFGRGIIASAATYILMAGDKPEMSANSWFMIHNVSGGIYGDVNALEQYTDTLRKFNNSVRDFYANYTNTRKEDITKMMDAETWMTAQEAKDKGFVKAVSADASFKNSVSPEHWPFANTTVLNAYNAAVNKPPQQETQQSFFKNQFEEMKKFIQDIVNAIKGTKPADNSASLTGEQIANAVQKPFEDFADEIDRRIKEGIENGLKGDAFTNAVNTAVTTATKTLTDQVTDLKNKNEDLEKEITNMKGKATGEKENNDDKPKPVGAFK